MGFAFADRGGGPSGGATLAPVFLLFLDCVHQLLMQFPLSFEFTTSLLIFLHEQQLACLHGTFLFNSDEERARSIEFFQTSSVWDSIRASPQAEWINALLEEKAGVGVGVENKKKKKERKKRKRKSGNERKKI